jgi:predicted Zn-dependent peptidase
MFGEIFGLGYQFNDLFIEELEKVTANDIVKVANKYFKQAPLKIILQPEK